MSMSYTLRMPDDLMRQLRQSSNDTGESLAQTVIIACWNYLESDRPSSDDTPAPIKPTVTELRQLVSSIHTEPDQPAVPVVMCNYSEWSEQIGETVQCGLPAHSLKQKHGDWIKF